MSYLYGIVLLITIIWLIKKRESYNPYDESYWGSGYYQSSFTAKKRCTDEICQVLEQLSGHKQIVRDFMFEREIWEGRKKRKKLKRVPEQGEVLLIHEAGVFVITSYDLSGYISGNIQGRYWVQSLGDSAIGTCINYILNPFMENKKIADHIRWICRDIQKLQFYSFAVFGRNCELQTEGCMEENKWSVNMQNFPLMIADVVRMKRRYLKPEEVDLIYERLFDQK